MAWPTRKQAGLDASEKKTYGKGVFRKCDGCNETMTAEALGQNFEVCPQCGQAEAYRPIRGARPFVLLGASWARDGYRNVRKNTSIDYVRGGEVIKSVRTS